jgi:hypothetical protein
MQPPAALASVPDWLRYTAVAVGFAELAQDRRSDKLEPTKNHRGRFQ